MSQFAPVPVYPVPTEELFELVMPAMARTPMDVDFEEALKVFMVSIMDRIRIKTEQESIEQAPFLFRSLLTLETLFHHQKRLLAEGLLLSSTVGDGVRVPGELLSAFASVPLKARVRGSEVKLIYEMRDLVAHARKAQREGRSATIMNSDPLAAPFKVDGTMATSIDKLLRTMPKEEKLGEALAKSNPPMWRPVVDDFPDYVEMMQFRDQALHALSPADREVFVVRPHPEGHQSLKVISAMLAGVPEDLRPTLEEMIGAGPWSLYPMLDGVPSWNYARYRDVVLKSPNREVTSGIPCMYGWTAAYYVARHGSSSEFSTVMAMWPEVAPMINMEGRPLLFEISRLNNAREKFEIALRAGADPNDAMPTGLSVMTSCLNNGSMDLATMLIEFGYQPDDDRSMDQQVIDRALNTPGIPPSLREALFFMRKKVPAQSELTALGAQFADLASAMPSDRMRPDRSKH